MILKPLLKFRPHLLAGLLFFGLTMAMTWPVVTQLNTHVTPGQQPAMTVPYLNLWTLAWNHQWLKGQTDSYWDANLFYPHQKTLAYSEPQFGMGLLTFPIVLLGANTVLAYNILLLGFVWGAGMTVYALCWYLFSPATPTYRWAAAVMAGVLYGFNFYMFKEMGVLQLLATLFLPLTFLGLHRFLNTNHWRDLLLFCIGFLGCWYTCGYYGLFLSVFVFCFVLKFWYRKILQWRILVPGVAALALTLLCLAPLIVGMQSAKTAMALSRPQFLVQNLSAVLSDYLRFPQYSWLYGKILGIASTYEEKFLGVILLCLAIVGTVVIFTKRSKVNTDEQHIPKSLFPVQYGKFYLTMAGLAFWLSYGMALTPANATGLGGYQIIAWLSPYNVLYRLVPGFSSIRSPYRFYICCVLFLCVLAGWGILWLSQRVHLKWRPIFVMVLLAAVVLELWPLPLRTVKVPGSIEELPAIYQHVKKLPPDATLLKLPLARHPSEHGLETEARYLYHTVFHWHRIANGYSGFSPYAYSDLKRVVAESEPHTLLAALKTFGIQYVLAHEAELYESEKKKLQKLEGNGLITLAQENGNQLYRVALPAKASDIPLPAVERLAFYESKMSSNHVTLSLHYRLAANQCELTTPWARRIECDVAWYPKIPETQTIGTRPDALEEKNEPVFISNGIYRNSKLLTKTSNVVELDLSAPPHGEYWVVVQHHSDMGTLKRSGICHIYENGFVTFTPIVTDKIHGG